MPKQSKTPRNPSPWPSAGYVAVQQILGRWGGPLPISPSRWWRGVASGEFPPPYDVGGRTCWRVEDVNRLMDTFAEKEAPRRIRRRGATGRPSPAA
ncbi:hypothetical protein BB934_22385 [Microvirga ossetica]|uniref:Uncharacterized protein n=1 Tax=Microvirga ossetica TaxID=1882682 RepID=A0A1B2EKY0_9HYPH|nr:hypothetical protein [Microvirga ossetica]ANY80638.1 hypothetical protein BB934_22385 [Microvirga ossetica]